MCWSMASLWLFTLLIHIRTRLAIETHATELHSCPVDCIVAWHNDCLLLLQHSALEAGATALGTGQTAGAGSKSAHSRPSDGSLVSWQWGDIARVHRPSSAGDRLRSGRVGFVW